MSIPKSKSYSLTVQIRLASDWRSAFIFLITLIDRETNIESHEHIEYIPSRDCRIKYNMYLLYRTRPKNLSKVFSVRIDAFNQISMKYRASWIFPLQFEFLPVHRLAVLLRVPFSTIVLPSEKCIPPCIHGQCSSYVNDPYSRFCQCESEWSGIQCNIELNCNCAFDSICISDSICLCSSDRWGPRCYLSQATCQPKGCMNGGQCAAVNAHYRSISSNSSSCICSEGYTGDHCEYRQKQTQIDISFHHDLTIPPSLLLHFIAVITIPRDWEKFVYENLEPKRMSIAKKLQFDQTSLIFYTTTSFNIVFAQIFDRYYLIVLHQQTIITAHISTEINPAHRCRSLVELFNETFVNQHLIKRIKFYHLPCQQHRELLCFYDDVHLCLCTLDRTANCWKFDHNMTYECEKSKYCGNDGQCFQDSLTCATSSFCACHRCYFGSRCQFSTKGSTLSLDIILGYHIRSKNTLNQQTTIVKSAIALTSIIFVAGMMNSFLSFPTFRGKETRGVGCGLYLFTTSILSMIIVVILALKFAFLVASQIGSINDRWFLSVQCISMDFLLRSLLSTSDWLSACVSIERAINVLQGVKFNKTKSRRVARWMILIVVLCATCSYIHDPIHRRLIDDEEEQRSWCVTHYSAFVQIFDSIINILHFTFPFVINGISALIVIITITRTRSSAQKTKSFKDHLYEQLHHHKHLLISPLILVLLALPRLVISFLSGCMESARQSWLYLIGYYISFIPAIMTLVVFILPSELYKKEFIETIKRVWR